MAKSVRVNFAYNILNTITGLLFPLITYPYAFRILMADGIGTINFQNSIISYIILLTSLGIPMYGIREIARVRDDERELTKSTLEILLLSLLLSIIGYLLVVLLPIFVSEINQNKELFFLLSTSILLTSVGCQWFYSGVEDFKFVAIRGLIVRIISTIFLFLVVKTKDDLQWYALYTVFVSTGNYVINFICLKNRISIRLIQFHELNLVKHIKPACAVFAFNLVTSIYINLDKVMLGLLQDSEAVGYYTAATQLSHILLSIAIALGAVMLPRSSNLIKQGMIDDFYRLVNKSYNFILMLAMPLCIGCIIMAPVLIRVFCGSSYEPSIITLRIICPIVIAIGISNLIGLQMLYPLGLIKIVTISTCIGAIVNVILNIVLIPIFSQDGAAIATILAETSVTITQILIANKFIKFKLISLSFWRYTFSAIIMGILCVPLMFIGMSDLISILLIPFAGVFIYGMLLLTLKDQMAIELFKTIKTVIKL